MTDKYKIIADNPDQIIKAIGEILESKKILFTKKYNNVFLFKSGKHWARAARVFLKYNEELEDLEIVKETD